jgi:coproporphyrinogen III oxidase-like Fe-S oxidoreductase
LPGAEVCIEGSPLTITAPDGEDKLCLLAQQGFTRLSFGVQSFDDAVLKYAGRGYRRDVAIHASQVANSVFDNWNLDLIQGLYKGSPMEVWQNLQVLSELKPPHLTWYHGRFANRPQGDWLSSEERGAGFEDETETLLGRMLIWQQMAALGYGRCDGNRFVRARRFADPFKKVRVSASSDLVGVGVSSYSHVGSVQGEDGCRGYVFRNDASIRTYVDRVLSDDVPIVAGRIIDDDELLAKSYATGLRTGRVADAALCAIAARRPRLSTLYRTQTDRLAALGVLDPYADDEGRGGLRLSELGRLFEDETLALFFSPSVRRALTGTRIKAVAEVV